MLLLNAWLQFVVCEGVEQLVFREVAQRSLFYLISSFIKD